MPNIFASADWHFQHTNITGPKVSKWTRGYRDFNSTEEMDRTILDNINSVIMPQDTLYFLGDFAFGNKDNIPKLRERINCRKIYFCRGNHDRAFDQNREYRKLFEDYRDYYEITFCKTLICMNHYSPRIWNESHHGSFALWGHSHSTLPETPYRSMDVGIDCQYKDIPQEKYMPFLLDDIFERLLKRPVMEIDHHTKNTDRKASYV